MERRQLELLLYDSWEGPPVEQRRSVMRQRKPKQTGHKFHCPLSKWGASRRVGTEGLKIFAALFEQAKKNIFTSFF